MTPPCLPSPIYYATLGRSCRQELELWLACARLENLGRFKMNKGSGY